ncbi:FliM/FliN family flagellar motor switch protein [Caulobacter sp.]|uniref:FliM/FliN family flagellar motor switch protein n=1 Tax=Caulobacter sp. TaxID=78 RepID=UPI00161B21C7
MSELLTPKEAMGEPLVARLPPLSPRLAAARERMLSILNRSVEGLTLKAAIVEDAPEAPWVVFDTTAGRVGLAQTDATPRDHAEVLARLDQLEPLLAALETGDFTFDPVDVEDGAEAALLIGLEAFDAEAVRRHAVVLALDLAAAEAWPELGAEADFSALSVPLPVVLTLDGPTVPASQGLGVGDVVLLPFGAERAVVATLAVAGRRARGAFIPAGGRFSINSLEPIAMSDLSIQIDPAASPDPGALADLPVTLRVALGEVTLTVAQLAALRPGSTVTLEVPPAEARAVLLAGERPVAAGRLVALGEAYGLVIDSLEA